MDMPDESAVRDALRTVDDPEAGMNIVELGLVYTITVTDAAIHVDMTMTTPRARWPTVITEQAKDAIQAIAPPGTDVQVQLVWEPFWTPSMMSGVAKDFFGWPGSHERQPRPRRPAAATTPAAADPWFCRALHRHGRGPGAAGLGHAPCGPKAPSPCTGR